MVIEVRWCRLLWNRNQAGRIPKHWYCLLTQVQYMCCRTGDSWLAHVFRILGLILLGPAAFCWWSLERRGGGEVLHRRAHISEGGGEEAYGAVRVCGGLEVSGRGQKAVS